MTDFPSRRMMMVDTQVRPSDVTKFPIIAAMLSVPREDFVPPAQREAAYAGLNVPLAANRVLVEARTLGKLLDFLDVQPGERVLDLGAGFGYASAILSEMGATVVAVEEDAALADAARASLTAAGYQAVTLINGPLTAGAPGQGPFDVIVVLGGVEQVPDTVLAQLREGGRIGTLFMQGAVGTAQIGHKLDGAVNWRAAFNATAPVLPGFQAKRDFVF